MAGQGTVVRHATAERGGVDGIGIRFVELAGAGRQQIEAILSEARAEP